MSVSAYFDAPRPRVLAHRGLALEAPENTMLAFVHAIAAGADYIETDVHASRDGVAIVSHDEELDRVAGLAGRVGDFTRDELARVDLGAGQSFPTLAEALDAFGETRFNIDVKHEAALGPAVDAVRAVRAEERVLLTSFSDARRRRIAAALPGVATSAGRAGVIGSILAAPFGGRALRRAVRGASALQVPEHAGSLRVVTPRLIRAAHAAGVEVHVWTVNEPADMRRLLGLGVDGLVTDRADLALPLVRG
ncbi:glycerophosphodiester phosphodiesterase [Agromyces archimandritae]|uniref:glycerophosphodiester phosphodiesterase n=1 Tax=Agromyces archimandritae TaxID=2781962 RepID=UPI001FD5CB5A|nr:glycerophosphodiester phosphodiesterase [Agromyces archimandritae]